MKAYLDTSVIIPALIKEHESSRDCLALLKRAASRDIEGCTSSQGLTEVYSILSRTPWGVRVTAGDALAMIERTLIPSLSIVDLVFSSYQAAISRCGNNGWRGGKVHDAAHIQAAVQAGCDVIYTYDLSDFELLAPEWAGRILRPAIV